MAVNPPVEVSRSEDGALTVDAPLDVFRDRWALVELNSLINKAFELGITQYTLIPSVNNHIIERGGLSDGYELAAVEAIGDPLSVEKLYIYFKNNMSFNGVGQLPATSEFTNVRKLPGSSILCPGFTMEFKNNLDSVAGTIALKSLIAKNNVTSTIVGSVLIYGNTGLDFKNNSDLDLQLSGSSPPAGFKGYGLAGVMPDPATYVEK